MPLLSVHQTAKNVNRFDEHAEPEQTRRTHGWLHQSTELMQSVRGSHSNPAPDSCYKDMSALCSQPESCINHMHLNAIIGATAKA